MRVLPAPRRRHLFAVGLAVLALWTAGGTPGDAGGAEDKAAPATKEKRVAFAMDGKPWGSVFEWLTNVTDKPVITNYKPTGTFTFVGPRGKTYTIPEVIDIINEALLSNSQTQKYYLINRERSFTLVPADEKPDPALLPRLAVEDLGKHGNTELVSVVLPLTSLVAEDVSPEIKKMMGPFGEVVAMAKANQLLLQDTVGNLKRIIKTLDDIEKNEKGGSDSLTYECKYIKAREAERILKELMGDPKEMMAAMRPPQQSNFGFDPRRGPPPAPAPSPKIRMHYIAINERDNSVLVTGPADKISQAKEILRRIDMPQKDQPALKVLVGPPDLKTYPVPAGNAEAISKTLQEIYKGSPLTRISAVGNNQILVYAYPDDQLAIAKQILGSADRGIKTETLPVGGMDAAKVAETLKGMFGEPKTGGPYVEALADQNAVVVRGTTEQVAEARAIVQTMAGSGRPGPRGGTDMGNVRIITLEKGSATTLAEALEKMLPRLIDNPVQVITPGGVDTPRPRPRRPRDAGDGEERPDAPTPPRMPRAQEDGKPAPKPGTVAPPLLVDPQEKEKKEGKEKPARKPSLRITAFGNRLIIASDDPRALALAQELVRLFTRAPGEGDFEVIKLKNALAADAAKALDEAFNGAKQTTQSNGGGGFFGRFGRGNAAPPPDPSANRIRVVAYPPGNALLVRASPLDLLTIRSLLARALDADEGPESNAVAKTWIIGPLKHASATDVANVVRDVYREQMNATPQNASVGGFRGFRFGGMASTQSTDKKPVNLSVGVDDRTNSLVVACSTPLYEDVRKLVDRLDTGAKEASRTVEVVPLTGIDPFLIQQAVDAFQGRTPRPRPTTTPGAGSMPGYTPPSFSPGGGGDRSPDRGGGGRGSRGERGSGGGGRGRSFFVERVTDDPETTLFFDPQHDDTSSDNVPSGGAALSQKAAPIQPVRYEEQQPPARPPQPARPANPVLPSGPLTGPRGPVTVEPLPELGVIVVSGNSPADVQAVLRIIEYLKQLGSVGNLQIELVKLDHADATSVAFHLSELFRQVVVGTSGNVRSTQPTQRTTRGPNGTQVTETSLSSVVLLPLPRQNAILVAAPRARVPDVVKEIKKLDQPTAPTAQPSAFPLKHASATRVATLLTSFYATRYPPETAAQNQIRITAEERTNTVFVQAAPADLAEIRELIARIDNTVSSAVNDLRVVPLRSALSEELSALLVRAIAQGGVPGTTPATTAVATPGVPGGPGVGPGRPGGVGAVPTAGIGPGASAPTTGVSTKVNSLRFLSVRRPGTPPVESGLLEDIRITADPRTNSLIISAPEKTMELIVTLIHELDVPPAARALINIFTLKNADAYTTATMLQQLFFGGGSLPGQGGAIPGQGGAGGVGGLPGAGGVRPLQLTMGALGTEGALPTELRISVDQRTNSILVAGSRTDMDVIEAIVGRLEDTEVQVRRNEVVRLKNSTAVDVANALNNFVQGSLAVLLRGQQLTAFQDIQREIVVVPEPITNKLLISATPRYFDDVLRMIAELDAELPQVVIQVLIAEVDLTGSEEFGVEIGLQSPVLFQRSVVPAPGLCSTGTSTLQNTGTTLASGPVPPGVTVNSTINPAANPGFAFLQNPTILGNNPAVNPSLVGYQGLGSLGVGRISPSSGIGGFVFSAASDSFNLLIRALKTQGRIDVLSRPQIMTLDNQLASISVGQSVPITGGAAVSGTGLALNSVQYRDVGVILTVIPKISPDGKVIMRVTPQISALTGNTVNLGTAGQLPIFNQQAVDTTVIAGDGETVAIGGLITRRDTKTENKIPWLGDLPGVGVLFRYRTQSKAKQELLVIMTPHIVRSRAMADRILTEEAHRMDWIVGDVIKTQGTSGMQPIFPPPPALGGPAVAPPGGVDGNLHAPLVPTPVPASPQLPAPPSGPATEEVLPAPRPLAPPGAPVPPAPAPAPAPAQGMNLAPGSTRPTALPATAAPTPAVITAVPGSRPLPTDAAPPPGATGYAPAASPDAPPAPPPGAGAYAPAPTSSAPPTGEQAQPPSPALPPPTPAPVEKGKESGRWLFFRKRS